MTDSERRRKNTASGICTDAERARVFAAATEVIR